MKRKTLPVSDPVFRQVYDSPASLPGRHKWLTPTDEVRKIEDLLGMPPKTIGAPLWVSGDRKRCPHCRRETTWLDIVASALGEVHKAEMIAQVILGDQKFVNTEAPKAIAGLKCFQCSFSGWDSGQLATTLETNFLVIRSLNKRSPTGCSNFLPILDNYEPPPGGQDPRVAPSPQRQQAMFDWWERLFDYTVMRRESQCSPERPAWLLFHEAAETHEDNPAHLLRHLGVDIRHGVLVLQYFDAMQADLSYDVTSDDLEDDRWAVRVWQSEKWVRVLLHHFYPKDITAAKVFLWVSDGPVLEGNANLTQFYRDGCIENGEPRRYKEIKLLNDGLRERGRQALVAYLTFHFPGEDSLPRPNISAISCLWTWK